jgi:hypothetical protein
MSVETAPPASVADAYPVLRAALSELFDYAGLYPPAALPMPEAVAAYARHQASPHAFMLGRLIVPAPRLGEVLAAQQHLLGGIPPAVPWRLSVGAGPYDTPALRAFAADQAAWAVVEALETRASTAEQVQAMVAGLPQGPTIFVEIPTTGDLEALLSAIHTAGACAKVRCGGLDPAAFPSSAELAGFVAACVRHGVPFKATAGLHHPLRSVHSMNMRPDGACATMHGYLNLLIAVALLGAHESVAVAEDVLESTSWSELAVVPDAITWRGRRLTAAELQAARQRLALSIGSCSFDEPVDDLCAQGLL